MSARFAARRLTPVGTLSSSPSLVSLPTFCHQRRTKWSVQSLNPFRKPTSKEAGSEADKARDRFSDLKNPEKRKEYLQRQRHEGTIFEEDEGEDVQREMEQESRALGTRTEDNMRMTLDPDPRSRVRWERRKVIQMVRRRRGQKMSKDEKIARTERQLLHKSEFMGIGLKKLTMLSRQIAGKTVDDAIEQMQWSKKKFAREVKYYLEEARDLAITQRGMGLGKANGELLGAPKKIQTKEGRWIEVQDPTRMYVAQSWIGRGPWRRKSLDIKGRGRFGIIQNPSTSITIVLKEEKTRIREHEERRDKKIAEGPWVHLPNRPVHHQRPYYSW